MLLDWCNWMGGMNSQPSSMAIAKFFCEMRPEFLERSTFQGCHICRPKSLFSFAFLPWFLTNCRIFISNVLPHKEQWKLSNWELKLKHSSQATQHSNVGFRSLSKAQHLIWFVYSELRKFLKSLILFNFSPQTELPSVNDVRNVTLN